MLRLVAIVLCLPSVAWTSCFSSDLFSIDLVAGDSVVIDLDKYTQGQNTSISAACNKSLELRDHFYPIKEIQLDYFCGSHIKLDQNRLLMICDENKIGITDPFNPKLTLVSISEKLSCAFPKFLEGMDSVLMLCFDVDNIQNVYLVMFDLRFMKISNQLLLQLPPEELEEAITLNKLKLEIVQQYGFNQHDFAVAGITGNFNNFTIQTIAQIANQDIKVAYWIKFTPPNEELEGTVRISSSSGDDAGNLLLLLLTPKILYTSTCSLTFNPPELKCRKPVPSRLTFISWAEFADRTTFKENSARFFAMRSGNFYVFAISWDNFEITMEKRFLFKISIFSRLLSCQEYSEGFLLVGITFTEKGPPIRSFVKVKRGGRYWEKKIIGSIFSAPLIFEKSANNNEPMLAFLFPGKIQYLSLAGAQLKLDAIQGEGSDSEYICTLQCYAGSKGPNVVSFGVKVRDSLQTETRTRLPNADAYEESDNIELAIPPHILKGEAPEVNYLRSPVNPFKSRFFLTYQTTASFHATYMASIKGFQALTPDTFVLQNTSCYMLVRALYFPISSLSSRVVWMGFPSNSSRECNEGRLIAAAQLDDIVAVISENLKTGELELVILRFSSNNEIKRKVLQKEDVSFSTTSSRTLIKFIPGKAVAAVICAKGEQDECSRLYSIVEPYLDSDLPAGSLNKVYDGDNESITKLIWDDDADHSFWAVTTTFKQQKSTSLLKNLMIESSTRLLQVKAQIELPDQKIIEGCLVRSGIFALKSESENSIILLAKESSLKAVYKIKLHELNATSISQIVCNYPHSLIHVLSTNKAGLKQMTTFSSEDLRSQFRRIHSNFVFVDSNPQFICPALSEDTEYLGVFALGQDTKILQAIKTSIGGAFINYELNGPAGNSIYKLDHECKNLDVTNKCSNIVNLKRFDYNNTWYLKKNVPRAKIEYGWLDLEKIAEIIGPYNKISTGQQSLHQWDERFVKDVGYFKDLPGDTQCLKVFEGYVFYSKSLNADSVVYIINEDQKYTKTIEGSQILKLAVLTKSHEIFFIALVAKVDEPDHLWIGRLTTFEPLSSLQSFTVKLKLSKYQQIDFQNGPLDFIIFGAVNNRFGLVYEIGTLRITSESITMEHVERYYSTGIIKGLLLSEVSFAGNFEAIYTHPNSFEMQVIHFTLTATGRIMAVDKEALNFYHYLPRGFSAVLKASKCVYIGNQTFRCFVASSNANSVVLDIYSPAINDHETASRVTVVKLIENIPWTYPVIADLSKDWLIVVNRNDRILSSSNFKATQRGYFYQSTICTVYKLDQVFTADWRWKNVISPHFFIEGHLIDETGVLREYVTPILFRNKNNQQMVVFLKLNEKKELTAFKFQNLRILIEPDIITQTSKLFLETIGPNRVALDLETILAFSPLPPVPPIPPSPGPAPRPTPPKPDIKPDDKGEQTSSDDGRQSRSESSSHWMLYVAIILVIVVPAMTVSFLCYFRNRKLQDIEADPSPPSTKIFTMDMEVETKDA